MSVEHSAINQTAINEQEKRHLLVSSYVGNIGEKLWKSTNKFSSRVLPCNSETCDAYSGAKLSGKL